MTLTRAFALPLLLTVAFGVSACGDDTNGTDSKAPASTPAQSSAPVSKATASDQAKDLKKLVASSQEEVQGIMKDIRSGKTTTKDGSAQIQKIVKQVSAATKAAAASAKSATESSVEDAKSQAADAKDQAEKAADDAKAQVDEAKKKAEDATK